MRLLVVSHACVTDVNQRIYRELARRGHDVLVATPSRWRHEYAPTMFSPGVLEGFAENVLPLPVLLPGSIQLHIYLRGVNAAIEAHAPDLIYIEEEPYSAAAFQWSAAASRQEIAVAFYTSQNIPKRYPWPSRRTEQFVWKRSGLAICVTDSVVVALRSRGYDGPTRVVPLPVETPDLASGPAYSELRKQLGLRERVIGLLGRLSPEKGVLVLLEAFRRLPGRDTTSLLCVGNGPLADECRAESGVIVRTVPHREVPAYIRLMDVVAMPSLTTKRWKEQFGRAAIEAMACGVPVVGSTSGEIPSLITGLGGGVIIPENDPDLLSNALASLLADPERRRLLGTIGQERVAASLSIAAVAQQLESALEELLAIQGHRRSIVGVDASG